jgi:hypothetical protein
MLFKALIGDSSYNSQQVTNGSKNRTIFSNKRYEIETDFIESYRH